MWSVVTCNIHILRELNEDLLQWLYDLRFSFLVVADVYIAALLCYFLHAMRSSHRRYVIRTHIGLHTTKF